MREKKYMDTLKNSRAHADDNWKMTHELLDFFDDESDSENLKAWLIKIRDQYEKFRERQQRIEQWASVKVDDRVGRHILELLSIVGAPK